MLGTEFLCKEVTRFFYREIDLIKQEINRRISSMIAKLVAYLMLFTFLTTGCIFGLIALAHYLNEILGSTYKGFLWISGGCVVIALLVMLISSMSDTKQSKEKTDNTTT